MFKEDKRENAKLAACYLKKRQAYEQLTEEEKQKASQKYEELRKEKHLSSVFLRLKQYQIFHLKSKKQMQGKTTWHP